MYSYDFHKHSILFNGVLNELLTYHIRMNYKKNIQLLNNSISSNHLSSLNYVSVNNNSDNEFINHYYHYNEYEDYNDNFVFDYNERLYGDYDDYEDYYDSIYN